MRNLEEIPVDSSKEIRDWSSGIGRLRTKVPEPAEQALSIEPGALAPRSSAVSESLARETGDISH